MSDDFAIIECRDVHVEFAHWGLSVQALNGLSLSVGAGEWVFVVGPNGAGKSTLLGTLVHHLSPSSGQVSICGKNVAGLSQLDVASLAYLVRQDPNRGSAPSLTVFENLYVADESSPANHHERTLRYKSLLAPYSLDHRLHQPASALSGGERQLLALLIAQLRLSPVVLLDEPLAALDPFRADQCLAVIKTLVTGAGSARPRTVLQVAHDLELASRAGNRTIVMDHGRIASDLKAAERSVEKLREVWFPAAGDGTNRRG